MAIEVGRGIDDIGVLQELLQFCQQPFLIGYLANDVQLVVLRLQAQLLPHIEQEVERIVGTTHLEGVAELKPVLLETEDVEVLLVEIAIQLMARASIAALMQMTPHGRDGCDDLHILEMVVNHQSQVLVHRKHSYRIEVGQHVKAHRVLLLLGEGATVHLVDILLVKQFHRHHQHVGVEHHPHSGWWVQQQVGCLKRLAQVGCHRYAALDDIRFVDDVFLILRHLRKRHRTAPYADGESLLVACYFWHPRCYFLQRYEIIMNYELRIKNYFIPLHR